MQRTLLAGISMNTGSENPPAELPEKDLTGVSSSLIIGAVCHHFGFRQDDISHEMKIHLRDGIYSIILLLANVAFLLLFMFLTTKREISPDTIGGAILLGFITILNWTVWHTYEHFVFGYRNLARKRWIFEKITHIPIAIRGY